jgi:lipoprotein-releasing system permease protein
MKTELFIGWRYLFTRRKEKFISLISLISILGIAIGVCALIVVIGVMTGFDKDLHDKMIGNYSHISISSYGGIGAKEYDSIILKTAPNPHVKGMSPYVLGQVLIKTDSKFFPVTIKGIKPYTETQVTKIKDYLVQGNIDRLQADREAVFIGKELAVYLGMGVGSTLTVYSPVGKQHTLRVAGIFYSRMYDYDMNLVFVPIETAQAILGAGDKISVVAVKLDNAYIADKVRKELTAVLGPEYTLKTWIEMNPNFFAALKLEKLTMFIILTLIVLVASFNIISTLIVMVVEKTKDVGVLKAVGMKASGIRRVFTYAGLIMGSLGTLLGACAGIGLCFLLQRYQFIKLPQDIYYIDSLPVSIQLWPDIVLIVLAAMCITLVSTLYPAAKAAGLKPVDALRYE